MSKIAAEKKAVLAMEMFSIDRNIKALENRLKALIEKKEAYQAIWDYIVIER